MTTKMNWTQRLKTAAKSARRSLAPYRFHVAIREDYISHIQLWLSENIPDHRLEYTTDTIATLAQRLNARENYNSGRITWAASFYFYRLSFKTLSDLTMFKLMWHQYC